MRRKFYYFIDVCLELKLSHQKIKKISFKKN